MPYDSVTERGIAGNGAPGVAPGQGDQRWPLSPQLSASTAGPCDLVTVQRMTTQVADLELARGHYPLSVRTGLWLKYPELTGAAQLGRLA